MPLLHKCPRNTNAPITLCPRNTMPREPVPPTLGRGGGGGVDVWWGVWLCMGVQCTSLRSDAAVSLPFPSCTWLPQGPRRASDACACSRSKMPLDGKFPETLLMLVHHMCGVEKDVFEQLPQVRLVPPPPPAHPTVPLLLLCVWGWLKHLLLFAVHGN